MKRKKILILSIAIIVILLLAMFLFITKMNKKEKNESFTLIMAGDALITNSILKDAYNELNTNYHFSKMLTYVKDYIKDYDLAFYNQETPITNNYFPYSGVGCYNTPSNFAIDMMNAGFNIINLANNHTLDGKLTIDTKEDKYTCTNNIEGVIYAKDFWNQYDEIYTVGINKSEEERNKTVVKELNGIKYTVLSYTYGTNLDNIIEYDSYLVNIYDEEQVKKDIENAKKEVDLVIVSMHWGEENNPVPTRTQKEQAKYLSSLGVDIIIGHHPHVVQPVEWIDNTLVIYSLGNIITAQDDKFDSNRLIGMLVGVTITKEENKIKIENVNCELTYNYYDDNKSNFSVIPYSYINYNEDSSEYIRLYEKTRKIVKMYDNNIHVNSLGTKTLNINDEIK